MWIVNKCIAVCVVFHFFMCLCTLQSLPIIEFSSLNLAHMKLIKGHFGGSEARAVYFDQEADLFYKVWPTTFWRGKHFVTCINNGFYDESNTPVEALIYENNACRGYVTRRGKLVVHCSEVKKANDCPCVIAPICQQEDDNYKEFYNDLLAKVARLKYVYIDFTPANIILEQEKYYRFIDLEPVVPVDIIHKQNFYNCPAYPQEYRKAISRIASGKRTAHLVTKKPVKKTLWRIHYTK